MNFHYLLPVFLSLIAIDDALGGKPPAFLIPGIYSSRIYAHYSPLSKWARCFGHPNKVLLWMNIDLMSDSRKFACLTELMTLRPQNDQGVKFTTGNTLEEIEYLYTKKQVPYFNSTLKMLRDAGYTEIHSLAYDFRWVPENLEHDIFPTWEKSILDANAKTRNKSLLICHSMGCKMTTDFLKHKGKDFVQKNVMGLFMVAGPYGGSVLALAAMVHGYNFSMKFGVPNDEVEKAFKYIANKLPSTYYLLPKEEFFKRPFVYLADGTTLSGTDGMETVLIGVKSGYNKTMFDLYTRPKANLAPVRQILGDIPAVCMYGVDNKTLLYEDDRDQNDKFKLGPGDGAVNLESLQTCKIFTDYVQVITDKNHMNILLSKTGARSLNKFMEIVLGGDYEELRKQMNITNWNAAMASLVALTYLG